MDNVHHIANKQPDRENLKPLTNKKPRLPKEARVSFRIIETLIETLKRKFLFNYTNYMVKYTLAVVPSAA